MNTTISAVLASVLVSVAVSSVGADQPATSLKTTPVAVSLFKNGLGYVAREGALPKGDAGAIIEGLPAVVHGTLWVYARGDGATVTDLVAFERDSIQPVAAVTLAELLEANVGETIDARLTGDKVVRGTIIAVPANRPASPPVMPMRPALYPTALHPTAIAAGETATLVLLQTDSGMVALNKSRSSRSRALAGRSRRASGARRGRPRSPCEARTRVETAALPSTISRAASAGRRATSSTSASPRSLGSPRRPRS